MVIPLSAECNHGEVRLVNSSVPTEGRVEVCVFSDWNSVCSNGWGDNDAKVVCRQLGYTPTGKHNDYYCCIYVINFFCA